MTTIEQPNLSADACANASAGGDGGDDDDRDCKPPQQPTDKLAEGGTKRKKKERNLRCAHRCDRCYLDHLDCEPTDLDDSESGCTRCQNAKVPCTNTLADAIGLAHLDRLQLAQLAHEARHQNQQFRTQYGQLQARCKRFEAHHESFSELINLISEETPGITTHGDLRAALRFHHLTLGALAGVNENSHPGVIASAAIVRAQLDALVCEVRNLSEDGASEFVDTQRLAETQVAEEQVEGDATDIRQEQRKDTETESSDDEVESEDSMEGVEVEGRVITEADFVRAGSREEEEYLERITHPATAYRDQPPDKRLRGG